MSVEKFARLLSELESHWRIEKAPILSKLNPGLKSPKTDIYGFSGVLPDEVWELYNWKNGVNPTPKDLIGNLKIFEMGIFLSLEDASEIQRIKADTELGWESTKYVMFESGGGEYYLIDGDTSSNSYGMLFYHSIGAVEHDMMISKYDSLYTLFLTINECTKEKIFSYANEKGFLRIDRDGAFAIAAKLNPRSDYWRL